MDRRTFLIAAASLPGMAYADLYDDFLNSRSKQPFVSFLARKGVPGHAFIGLGTKIDASLTVYEYLFGLYPKNGSKAAMKSIFSRQSGDLRVDPNFKDVKWDVEFQRNIEPKQHEKVKAKMEEWKVSAPPYSLLANDGKNCSALAGAVAVLVGMKDPGGAGTTLPWNYIEALKKTNP